MSKTFVENEKYSLTAFYGGDVRGRCLQITPQIREYIQLTVEEVQKLKIDLELFLSGDYRK